MWQRDDDGAMMIFISNKQKGKGGRWSESRNTHNEESVVHTVNIISVHLIINNGGASLFLLLFFYI